MEELWETLNKIRSACIHIKLNLDELYSIGIDGLTSTDDEDLPQPVINWVHGTSTDGKADYLAQSKVSRKETLRPVRRHLQDHTLTIRDKLCQTCTIVNLFGQNVLNEIVPNAETLLESIVSNFLKHHPEHVNS